MRPIHFSQQNCIMGHDQLAYAALPAFRGSIPNHPTPGRDTEVVISCYRLTDSDLERLCRDRVVWMSQVVTRGGPLQPQMLSIEDPFVFEDGSTWDGRGTKKENWKQKKV